MNELLLLVAIAGQSAALRSNDVQSVVEIETLTPVPRAPAHIAGLSALRSRVLTAIDCKRALGLEDTGSPSPGCRAAIVEREGHLYALLLESIEDVTVARSDPAPVETDLGEGWERVALGMVETDRGLTLLVDPARLIEGA